MLPNHSESKEIPNSNSLTLLEALNKLCPVLDPSDTLPIPNSDSNYAANLFSDPEKPLKFFQALMYCNTRPIYLDPKLVDKSCLFDTSKFEIPQIVRKPYYRNGRKLFISWSTATGQGTRHGAEQTWKKAGAGSALWVEWEGRRRDLVKEQNEQDRRGMIVVRRNAA